MQSKKAPSRKTLVKRLNTAAHSFQTTDVCEGNTCPCELEYLCDKAYDVEQATEELLQGNVGYNHTHGTFTLRQKCPKCNSLLKAKIATSVNNPRFWNTSEFPSAEIEIEVFCATDSCTFIKPVRLDKLMEYAAANEDLKVQNAKLQVQILNLCAPEEDDEDEEEEED